MSKDPTKRELLYKVNKSFRSVLSLNGRVQQRSSAVKENAQINPCKFSS